VPLTLDEVTKLALDQNLDISVQRLNRSTFDIAVQTIQAFYAPTVTSITPNTGTANGGTAVTLTGTGFLAGATVSLGGTAATGVTVVNSTTITATTPAHAAGAVNVVVTNSDTQSGTLSNGYSYTTSTGGGTIGFVQVNAATPQTASASVPIAFGVAQTAGNMNLVVVGWNDTTSTVSSVSDSRGNTYTQAGTTVTGTGLRQAIYYARNIVGGSNTVTVGFNQAAAFADVRILEYSGLDPTSPLDVTAGAAGTSSSPNSGAATTTAANPASGPMEQSITSRPLTNSSPNSGASGRQPKQLLSGIKSPSS